MHINQAAIEAVLCNELVVGAALDDNAVVHDDNEVGMADGGEAVGNDDAGASLHELVEGLLHGHLAFGVEGAGGFVKDEDGRVFEHGAGYAEALALSTAEGDAAVAYVGVVALGQLGDEFVGVGYGGCTTHMFRTVVSASEGYVVGHSVVEKDAVLRHKAYLCAQAVDVEVSHGVAVNEYVALGAVVKSGQEVNKSGFARPRGTYDCDGLPAGDVEVDVAEHIDGVSMAVGAVGKGDVAVLYGRVEALENDGVGFFDDGFVGIHDFEDACGGGVGFLQVVVNAHDGLHGRYKACEEDDEEDKDRGEKFTLEDGEATEDEDKDKAYGEEYFRKGAAKFATGGYMHHAVGIGAVGPVETVGGIRLPGESLYGADTREVLFENGEEVAKTRLPFDGTAAQAASDDSYEPYSNGHDDEEV